MTEAEEVVSSINNLSHAPEIARALGEMVVAWAYAEETLCICFAHVLGVHPNQVIGGFYRIMTFEAKAKVVLGAMEDWDHKDKEKIQALIDRISGQADARNGWVHGSWCRYLISKETAIIRLRKPIGRGRVCRVLASDIEAHTAALRTNTQALSDLLPET